MKEIWRNINGYDGYYKVSNFGRIKSYKFRNHILRPYPSRGYYRCILMKDGIRNTTLIHLSVVKAFPEICGEWFEGCHVHHINGNSLDNRAENLKVVSKEEHFELHKEKNIRIGKTSFLGKHHTEETKQLLRNYRLGSKHSQEAIEKIREASTGRIKSEQTRKLISERRKRKVIQYSINNEYIREFDSLTEAAQSIGRTYTAVYANIKGITQVCGGYKWEYKKGDA